MSDKKLRVEQAIKYLKDLGVDIFSLSDYYYKNAIFIAAGLDLDEANEMQKKHEAEK